jgi:phosphinothricin acetyltransferase
VTIRPAVPGDAPALLPIVNAIIRDTAVTFTDREKTEADLRKEIEDRAGACFVAEQAGQVVGYAGYAQFRGGPGYARTMEHSIALAPEAQRHGTGRALMARLCDHAKSRGVHCLIAAVSAENPDGVAFHARLGFVQVALLREVGVKFGRHIDLVMMQKFL